VAKLPGYDWFEAAFVNCRLIACDVASMDEAIGLTTAARGQLIDVSAGKREVARSVRYLRRVIELI
jgi:hypothetical protein